MVDNRGAQKSCARDLGKFRFSVFLCPDSCWMSMSDKSPMHSSSRDQLEEIGFCHSVLEQPIALLSPDESHFR
jgi:hypothetical protein